MNILFPMNKKSAFFTEEQSPFPVYLQEIENKPILKLVVANYDTIVGDKHYVFLLNKADCMKYYVDNVTKLITNTACTNIVLESDTKGSVCTCLMAIDHIDNEEELIIANTDQIFELDLNEYIDRFREDSVDAAVLSFDSIHPRWSFVRTEPTSQIIEAAEKRPISKNAVAGLYYFKQGKMFVKGAMKAIKRGIDINGSYYISQVLNELILENYMLKAYPIETEKFFTLYSPEKVMEYRDFIRNERQVNR